MPAWVAYLPHPNTLLRAAPSDPDSTIRELFGAYRLGVVCRLQHPGDSHYLAPKVALPRWPVTWC